MIKIVVDLGDELITYNDSTVIDVSIFFHIIHTAFFFFLLINKEYLLYDIY